MILKKLEALVRTVYCEGATHEESHDLDMLPSQLKAIAVVGLIFTLWNTLNLVLDILQGFKLIFTRYFIGGVLLLAGCAFGVIHRRRGDSLMRGNGLLWAPMGQDPYYYMSQVSKRRQRALRAIFCLLFTEVAIFIFQDAVLLQVWLFAGDAYDDRAALDAAASWITCISAVITFLLLTFSLIVACCNMHWMPGFCSKLNQIARALVSLLVFTIVYLFLLGLVTTQLIATVAGDDFDYEGNTIITNGDPDPEKKTTGGSAMISVFFLWTIGTYFSCSLRNQAFCPRPLVASVRGDEEDYDPEKGKPKDVAAVAVAVEDTEVDDDEICDDDVCFGKQNHPGTEKYLKAIREIARKCPDDEGFSEERFQTVLAMVRTGRFFVPASSQTWREIEEGETRETTRKLFVQALYELDNQGGEPPRKSKLCSASAPPKPSSRKSKKTNTRVSKPEQDSRAASPENSDKIDTMDICIGCSSHPGTQSWQRAVEKSLDVFPDSEYCPEVYRYIKHQFPDREFWINRSGVEWKIATKKEIVLNCQEWFERAQQQLFDDAAGIRTSNNNNKRTSKKVQRQQRSSLPQNPMAGTFDVCLDCMNYPGTRSWHKAIEQYLEDYPDAKFSPAVFRRIRAAFEERRFWIYTNGQWKAATEQDIKANCRRVYSESQKQLFDDIMGN